MEVAQRLGEGQYESIDTNLRHVTVSSDHNSIDKAPPAILDDEIQKARAPGKGLSEHKQISIKLQTAVPGHRPSSHL